MASSTVHSCCARLPLSGCTSSTPVVAIGRSCGHHEPPCYLCLGCAQSEGECVFLSPPSPSHKRKHGDAVEDKGETKQGEVVVTLAPSDVLASAAKKKKAKPAGDWEMLDRKGNQMVLSVDVESSGLPGTPFGIGLILYDKVTKEELEVIRMYGPLKETKEYGDYLALMAARPELKDMPEELGKLSRIPYVEEHVVPAIPTDSLIYSTLAEFMENAWYAYRSMIHRVKACTDLESHVISENGYPVETTFFFMLCQAVDLPTRRFQGPFPLHGVATMVLSCELSPAEFKEINKRQPNELPCHDPVCDARQSLRIWIESQRIRDDRFQAVVGEEEDDRDLMIANGIDPEEIIRSRKEMFDHVNSTKASPAVLDFFRDLMD